MSFRSPLLEQDGCQREGTDVGQLRHGSHDVVEDDEAAGVMAEPIDVEIPTEVVQEQPVASGEPTPAGAEDTVLHPSSSVAAAAKAMTLRTCTCRLFRYRKTGRYQVCNELKETGSTNAVVFAPINYRQLFDKAFRSMVKCRPVRAASGSAALLLRTFFLLHFVYRIFSTSKYFTILASST